MTTLPDCAWCSAADTLTEDWAEQGETYCTCSCCGKQTMVCRHGEAVKMERRRVEQDISGHEIFES